MIDRPVHPAEEAVSACELTVLMPCLNEGETVGTCVAKAKAYLESRGVDGEVLVADNGSTDGSREIVTELGGRVVEVAERGYGNALKAGIDAARGRYVVMGDADDSYDFSALDPFLEQLREGAELVMGNRFAGGIEPEAMPFLHRYLGNPVLSWIGRVFYRSPVGDFHCGLRGFRTAAIRRLGLRSGGMEFASEMVVKATLHDLRIVEVPTSLSPDGRTTPPHLRTWRDGWRHLRFLLLFSPRWLFLYPGMALFALGLGSLLWLLPGPRVVGGAGLSVNTVIYSGAAMIIGFQVVAFALFAKIYAIEAGFLPEDARIRNLGRLLSLEVGILAGLVLFLAGFAGAVYALGVWGRASLGALDPTVSVRIVVPSATAMVLGLQIVFSSFFLSVLGLRRE